MKIVAVLSILAFPMAAEAPASGDQAASNPLVASIAACLRENVDARRLACFDAAAARLVTAERQRDVIVVDHDEVSKARRSLFGLTLGTGDIFAGRDKASDRVDRLETTLLAARENGDGGWTLVLREGGQWRTTEAWTVTSTLKPGTAVVIHPGALGSYVAKIGHERIIRVRRTL